MLVSAEYTGRKSTRREEPQVTTKTRRTGQRKKSIEEVVAYAVGHRIRVHVLIVLNEGTYTPGEIARIIDEPLNNVSNHIRELLDAGSIELAETKRGAEHHPALTTERSKCRSTQDEDMAADDLWNSAR